MSSQSSIPDSTPPFSSSVSTMDAQRSARKASSPANFSSPATSSTSRTPVPESSQQRAQIKKKKAPSLRQVNRSAPRPQSIVTIFIGPEESKEIFNVHKDIICHYSSFFAKAFSSTLLEGKTHTMNLPDVDSDIFGILVEWFYTQRIDLDPTDRDSNVLFLAKLWSLAQRFAMPSLQNKVMDGLRPLVECVESEGLKGFLQYAYESKNGKSRLILRKLAADRMAWSTSAKGLLAWMEGGFLPQALVIDIVMSLKVDHAVGVEPKMKFGSFPSAKDYYVVIEDKLVGMKEEK
ncbi:hypothetical protein VTL71DRAFT_1317 [Oculimacula yallundae]|uniref:BTB domain-containing protein n=1 Tax=Oculimacula yallundae TaxID=86028 RepID=A0ABR4CCS0_9HELO